MAAQQYGLFQRVWNSSSKQTTLVLLTKSYSQVFESHENNGLVRHDVPMANVDRGRVLKPIDAFCLEVSTVPSDL